MMDYIQLAILFVIFIALLMALRMLLAQRVPERMRFVASDAPDLADAWRPYFDAADRELRALGFEPFLWTRTDYAPEDALMPPFARYYRDGDGKIFARVAPPNVFLAPDRCLVALFSRARDGAVLATADRIPELLPRPPRETLRGAVIVADTLSTLWTAHLAVIDDEEVEAIHEPDTLLEFLNDYERDTIQWYRGKGLIRPHPGGGFVPHWRPALRFLFRSLIGKELQNQPEAAPIEPQAAAALFRQWQAAQRLSPTPLTQGFLLLLTSLLFVLAAAAIWDWRLAALLLPAILLHELGHYLAMRWLGYHNLQILMLPLIGGIASGIERRPAAANRAFVFLMGPLPGILLGWLLLVVALQWDPGGMLYLFAIVLLVLNYFNLLPIPPLDGGQFLKAMIPARALALLILIELGGAAALLWLGFQIDGILALIGLIPLFAAFDLWRKRKILAELREVSSSQDEDPAARVIACYDRHKKNYKPVMQKARAIQDLLDGLTIKPPAPLTRALLLGLYLAIFALPLAWAWEYVGGFAYALANDGRMPNPLEEKIAASAQLEWPRLLKEMEEMEGRQYADLRQRRGDARSVPPAPPRLLREPASPSAIAAVQRRLQMELPTDYLAFLRLSNGYLDAWDAARGAGEAGHPPRGEAGDRAVAPSPSYHRPRQNTRYWLLPVEEIDTFERIAPELLREIRLALSQREGAETTIWVSHGAEFTRPGIEVTPRDLDNMVVIGVGGMRDELLLLAPGLAESPGETPVMSLNADLLADRYPDFHAFMASRHAFLRIGEKHREERGRER